MGKYCRRSRFAFSFVPRGQADQRRQGEGQVLTVIRSGEGRGAYGADDDAGAHDAHTLRSSEPGEPHGAAVIASLERAVKMPIASFYGCYRADSFVVPCWQDEAVVREVVDTERGLARERTRRAPGWRLLPAPCPSSGDGCVRI